jgi:hypothetical protein
VAVNQEAEAFFAQPGAGLFTQPGGVMGGPLPCEWVTPALGLPPDGWPRPLESPAPFPAAPDDAPEVPGFTGGSVVVVVVGDDDVVMVVGEEGVVVVDMLVPEPVGEEPEVVVGAGVRVCLPVDGAVVVGRPVAGRGDGAVVAAEPSPGPEEGAVAAPGPLLAPEEGAVVAAEPSPGPAADVIVLPGLEAAGAEFVPVGEATRPAAAGFSGDDADGFESGKAALVAPGRAAPTGATVPVACADAGRVTPAGGSTMPGTSGVCGERSSAGCAG